MCANSTVLEYHNISRRRRYFRPMLQYWVGSVSPQANLLLSFFFGSIFRHKNIWGLILRRFCRSKHLCFMEGEDFSS